MSDSISIYLQEIGKTPLLNAADERTLSKAIEAGRAADARIAAGEKSVALRREARAGAEAKERFKDSKCVIDEKSFRISTPADYKANMSLFY